MSVRLQFLLGRLVFFFTLAALAGVLLLGAWSPPPPPQSPDLSSIRQKPQTFGPTIDDVARHFGDGDAIEPEAP